MNTFAHMKKSILFILLLLSASLCAQQDSSAKNEFTFYNTLKTRDVYVGTYDNLRANVLLNTELKYWFSFGLYAAIAPDIIVAGKKGGSISDIGFTVGYDQYFMEDDALNINVAYTFFWQNVPSKAKLFQRIRNIQNHDLYAYVGYEQNWYAGSLNLELLTGTVTDFIITPEFYSPMYIFENDQHAFSVRPYVNMNIGSANNLQIYDTTSTINKVGGMTPLNMETGLRVNYSNNLVEIEPFFSYSHALYDFNSAFIRNKDVVWGGIKVGFTF